MQQIDQQFKVTETTKKAWSATTRKAKAVDEKYGISEKASEVAKAAQERVSKMDQQLGISARVSEVGKSVSSLFGFKSPTSEPSAPTTETL